MGFIDELRQRNTTNALTDTGSTGGIATPRFGLQEPDVDPVSMANNMLPVYQRRLAIDRQDFEAKNNFMSDLSLKQQNLQRIFNPNQQQQGQQPNVVFNPLGTDGIAPVDKAKLDLEKQKLQQGQVTDKAELDLKQKALELDKEKNKNIYDTKQQDMQRKVDDADARLKLAFDRLNLDANNATAHANFNKAQMDATEARHALELTQRQKESDDRAALYEAQIKKMEDDAALAREPVNKDVEMENDPATGKQRMKSVTTKGAGDLELPGGEKSKVPPDIQKKALSGGWKYVPKPGGGYTAVPSTKDIRSK